MQQTGREQPIKGAPATELAKNRAAITQLAQSGEAKQLMSILRRQGGVQKAAEAAAAGDPSQLMAMVDRLMGTREGADLVERISGQAKKAGLK